MLTVAQGIPPKLAVPRPVLRSRELENQAQQMLQT